MDNYQKGFIHVLLLFLLVIGIGVGVYLVTHPQIFKSKASQSEQNSLKIKSLTTQINSKAENQEQSLIKADLVELAKERKELLLEEMKVNPKILFENRISEKALGILSDEVKQYIEKEVELEGDLEVLYLDSTNFEKGELLYTLKDQQKNYKIYLTSSDSQARTGSKVKAVGLELDSNVAVENKDLEILSETAIKSTGLRKGRIIMVNFANLSHSIVNYQDLLDQLVNSDQSIGKYFKENSYGKLNYELSIEDQILTIPSNSGGCDYTKWTQEANREHILKYQRTAQTVYDDTIYIFPSTGGCNFGGIAYLGGNTVVIAQYTNVASLLSLITHELGHNLGLKHSNSWTCKDRTIGLFPDCYHFEYGDKLDVMGSSNRLTHLSFYKKEQLGWTKQSDSQTVTAKSGVYNVYPLEVNDDQVKALVLEATSLDIGLNKPLSYQITYRRPIGFDKNSYEGYQDGVTIHLIPDANYMINPTLVENYGISYKIPYFMLKDNATFVDPYNFYRIKQISHDDQKAVISIEKGSFTDKFGINLKTFLANNPALNEKKGFIIFASKDISNNLKELGVKVRSVVKTNEKMLITADVDMEDIDKVAKDPEVISIDLPESLFLTSTKASRCQVSWEGISDSYSKNTDFTPTIEVKNSSVGSGYVTVYLDDAKVEGGVMVGDKKVKWTVNSGNPGVHKLSFKVNDWERYKITGQDPAVTETCSPTLIFFTNQ